MVPNLFAAVMLVAFVTAIEIQVRLAEEPFLIRVHGDEYRR
jgi:protein-S-isoprenylcysteine O-methyltransferase Ste14